MRGKTKKITEKLNWILESLSLELTNFILVLPPDFLLCEAINPLIAKVTFPWIFQYQQPKTIYYSFLPDQNRSLHFIHIYLLSLFQKGFKVAQTKDYVMVSKTGIEA